MVCMLVAWGMSSCATQVYLNRWEPSQVDLARGSALRVLAEAHGPLRYELKRAFQQQIAADGFYCVARHTGDADVRLHHVEVDMEHPPVDDGHHGDRHEREEHERVREVELTADVICNYQRIYRRECSALVSYDIHGHPDWEAACESIAAKVMRDLTPHIVRYSVGVDAVEGNPAVEQAAQACAAGNWEQGRSLAHAALQQNPDEPEACYMLGVIERNARNYTASDSWFRKANSLRPASKYSGAIRDNAHLQAAEQRARYQLER